MRRKIGLVAFSFALRIDKEPNPCNVRLAYEVGRIVRKHQAIGGNEVVVVSQWEVAKALRVLDKSLRIARVVEHHHVPGKYLGSEEIIFQAIPIFKREGITDVIIVAQPFLQIHKCYGLVKSAGFNVIKERIGWIGFDPKSDQVWARSAWRVILYAVSQKLFGRHG